MEGSQKWEAGCQRQSTSFKVPPRAAPGVNARATVPQGICQCSQGGENSGARNNALIRLRGQLAIVGTRSLDSKVALSSG